MFVGIGIGIARRRFAGGFAGSYSSRVIADGGAIEALTCVAAASSLLQSASLLIIPSGYKAGVAYAELPTNGNGDLTWSRNSVANRTNASGLIQQVPYNLLRQSETFTDAVWIKQSGTTIVSTNNLAPNGNLNASFVTGSGTSGILQSVSGLTTSTTYTRSIYLKGALGGEVVLVRDPQTGGPNPKTLTTSWVRYDYTVATDGTGFGGIWIDDIPTSGIYIWGAQLVEGTTAQTYLPTTDRLKFPRLDYTYGSCPALLLEPQRTNLLTYSQAFSDASWGKIGIGSGNAPIVTANAGVSPDGTTNASRVQFNCVGTTNSDRSILQKASISISNATNYAGGIYVKAYSSSEIGKQLRFVIEQVAAQVIIILTDSWQRVSATGVSSSTSTNYIIETRGTVTTNTTADVLLWGAQFEQGAYPTTYIPTTTAAATRLVDTFTRNNIYTNGLISASGGTWFVELRGNVVLLRDGSGTLSLDTNSAGLVDGFAIRKDTSTNRLYVAKVISSSITYLYLTTTETVKIAIKWNGSTADVFVNGTKQVSATAFTTKTMEFLIGNGNDVPKFIQAMALYPTPISDADCEVLTGTSYSSYSAMATALGYTIL